MYFTSRSGIYLLHTILSNFARNHLELISMTDMHTTISKWSHLRPHLITASHHRESPAFKVKCTDTQALFHYKKVFKGLLWHYSEPRSYTCAIPSSATMLFFVKPTKQCLPFTHRSASLPVHGRNYYGHRCFSSASVPVRTKHRFTALMQTESYSTATGAYPSCHAFVTLCITTKVKAT